MDKISFFRNDVWVSDEAYKDNVKACPIPVIDILSLTESVWLTLSSLYVFRQVQVMPTCLQLTEVIRFSEIPHPCSCGFQRVSMLRVRYINSQ